MNSGFDANHACDESNLRTMNRIDMGRSKLVFNALNSPTIIIIIRINQSQQEQ